MSSDQQGRSDIKHVKALADCREIFRRFWPDHYREHGNCHCPFHDHQTADCLQVTNDLAYCHGTGDQWDAIDLYRIGAKLGSTGEAIHALAREVDTFRVTGGGEGVYASPENTCIGAIPTKKTNNTKGLTDATPNAMVCNSATPPLPNHQG